MDRDERRRRLLKYGVNRRWPMAHMVELDDRYPAAEMFGPGCVSAEVGQGWTHLLELVLQPMVRLSCTLGQAKQKFCELVVYWDPPEWVPAARTAWRNGGMRGPDPITLFADVASAVAVAAEHSLRTCELCGGADDTDQAGLTRAGRRLCTECEVTWKRELGGRIL